VGSVRPGHAFAPWDAVKEVGLVGSLLSSHETGRFAGPDRAYAYSVQTRGTLAVAFAALVVANAIGAWWSRGRGHRFEAALCTAVTASAVLAYVSAMTARGNRSHHIVMFVAGIGLVAWLAVALVGATAAAEIAIPWARRSGRRLPHWTTEHTRGMTARVTHSRRWTAAGLLGLTIVVAVVTVPLVRRPSVLVNPVGPDLEAIATLIAPRPGERIVIDTDPFGEGPLFGVLILLAVDGHDVRVPDKWRVQFTAEQAAPSTWDRSIYLDLPGGPHLRPGWHELGTIELYSGRDVRVLSRGRNHGDRLAHGADGFLVRRETFPSRRSTDSWSQSCHGANEPRPGLALDRPGPTPSEPHITCQQTGLVTRSISAIPGGPAVGPTRAISTDTGAPILCAHVGFPGGSRSAGEPGAGGWYRWCRNESGAGRSSMSCVVQTGAGFLRAKASWRWYGKCG
jgi:hypothetical protein